MKKSHAVGVIVLAIGFLGLAIAGSLKADTGREAATRIERGSYAAFRIVSASSYTGTALFAVSNSRPDGVCFNNTAYTIWLGSSTATSLTTALHPHHQSGFPVLSSGTFMLDGQMTGAIYATCNPGVSSCELRCLDGRSAQ